MRVQIFVDGEFQGKVSRAEADRLIEDYRKKRTYKIEDYGTYVNIYNIRKFRKKK